MLNTNFLLAIGAIIALLLAFKPNKWLIMAALIFHLVIVSFALGWQSLISQTPYLWSTQINVSLTYQTDGLAKLFLLLISGIGSVILLYSRIYLQHKLQHMAKMMALLQFFSVSMIGLVWTDHMLMLYVFWELTSISSYLLIQFNETDSSANQAAFNALFVTAAGGLAMLTAFILMAQLADTFSIQSALSQLTDMSQTTEMKVIFALFCLGAFTKSAQFPFHFWLAGAMKAPTPVSAYLHSATMVNAGIYVLARFHPLFVHSPLWYYSLALIGLATMVIGSVLSLFQDDMKSLLAYTTLFALGSMVYLLASNSWLSAEALGLFLLFHGVYKAAAFMLVGTLDQEYGTRNLSQLNGLGRQRPLVGLYWFIIFSAMAGWPPLYGFVVKQMIYEAKLAKIPISYSLVLASVISSLFISATGFKCLWTLFRQYAWLPKTRTLSWGMTMPSILVSLVVIMSFFNAYTRPLIKSAADAIVPTKIQTFILPNQWTSISLSLTAMLGGILVFMAYRYRPHWSPWPHSLTFKAVFEKGLQGVVGGCGWLVTWPQRAGLFYQITLVMTGLLVLLGVANTVLSAWSNATAVDANWPSLWVIALLLAGCAISLLMSRSFLMNVVSLSVLGLVLSFFFVTQGAPDVAITQLLVEILTVVIIVLALCGAQLTYTAQDKGSRLWRAILASLIGFGTARVLWPALSAPYPQKLRSYFIDHSLDLAHGKNVVNVILVDFRAFDTLGETLVILGAAVGVWLLMKQNTNQKKE